MGLTWLSFLEFGAYISIINYTAGSNSCMAFEIISFIIALRLFYLCVMYYMPCLQNKTALELDSEKLQCFIEGKLLFKRSQRIIYWKDIEKIDFNSIPRGNALMIIFKIKDSKSAGVYTKYIAGNDRAIYDTITAYFEKYK